MSDLEHARLLLSAAHSDLRALYGMLDAVVFSDEVFGSLFNQVAGMLSGDEV